MDYVIAGQTGRRSSELCIALDSHKQYTLASVERQTGELVCERRLGHNRGLLRQFLQRFDSGSPVAVETIGNWYWIVDEIEEAGMVPRLVHARKAKLMMGLVSKSDKLDARGMNLLYRNGTLPRVWIPPKDMRDLPRTRMVLTKERTRLKNRIHSTLSKYAIRIEGVSDVFGVRGRKLLEERLALLPPHTRFSVQGLLTQLDLVIDQIKGFESRMREIFKEIPELELVMSPAGNFASYSGTVPRERSSGGKIRFGRLRPDVNHYLKWAYVEAANVVPLNRRLWRDRHVCAIYGRIAKRRGHPKAIGAVARHLSEATGWMLTKGERYKEPCSAQTVSSTAG